jgi:hypothetical protein
VNYFVAENISSRENLSPGPTCASPEIRPVFERQALNQLSPSLKSKKCRKTYFSKIALFKNFRLFLIWLSVQLNKKPNRKTLVLMVLGTTSGFWKRGFQLRGLAELA